MGHVLLAADAKEPVTVRLQPGAVLTGRAVDEDGKPLAGVSVNIGYQAPEIYGLVKEAFGDNFVKTDSEGRFRVEGIFPGMKFVFGFAKGRDFLVPDKKYLYLTLEEGTRDLGDIVAKPFRPE